MRFLCLFDEYIGVFNEIVLAPILQISVGSLNAVSERSLSCLNLSVPLSLGVEFCRQLLVLKSSAPLGSIMCVYTLSNRNGV